MHSSGKSQVVSHNEGHSKSSETDIDGHYKFHWYLVTG